MSLNSNLKIDEVLRGVKFTENKPRIFSNGAYLVPMKISIKGIAHYVWVADDFKDETFNSDGENISPNVITRDIENLYE